MDQISPKRLKWIKDAAKRTDQERAEHRIPRLKRLFACYKLLARKHRWWTVAEIQSALNLESRAVRRVLDDLAAADEIELQRGGSTQGQFGANQTRARIKKSR